MTVAAPSPVEPFVRRPTLASAAAAMVAGTFSIGLLAGSAVQRRLLAVAVVGVAAFAVGGRLWRRDRGTAGAVLALCGCLLVAVAAGYATVRPPLLIQRFELFPGILGLWVLAAALVPVRFGWSRMLVDAGTGLLFVAVLVSGVVRGASTGAIVVAAAATVLAWDAAENAVSMGGQTGADAATDTRRAELVHVGATAGVAVVAVAVVLGIAQLGIEGLPLAALVSLLVAGIVLALVYHR